MRGGDEHDRPNSVNARRISVDGTPWGWESERESEREWENVMSAGARGCGSIRSARTCARWVLEDEGGPASLGTRAGGGVRRALVAGSGRLTGEGLDCHLPLLIFARNRDWLLPPRQCHSSFITSSASPAVRPPSDAFFFLCFLCALSVPCFPCLCPAVPTPAIPPCSPSTPWPPPTISKSPSRA